jgi:Protein of unknown function (DUF2721)
MLNVSRLFQAFVAPAIFISAAALLMLSLNARLMAIVSRLRQFLHDRYVAASNERENEVEAYTAQMESIERRAEKIRHSILLVLASLIGTTISCLLLGMGLYWQFADLLAVVIFVSSVLCMLMGAVYYLAEITVALSSVREEAKHFDSMRGHVVHEHERTDRCEDWQRFH